MKSKHFQSFIFLPKDSRIILISLWSICYFSTCAFADTSNFGIIKKEAKPGWVRFCSGNNHFDVFSNQCPAGFFWKPDFKFEDKNWDCVCTRGPWRRSNKWCSKESSQRFTEKDVSCFKPDSTENLEGMLYLGDQYSAWDTSNPFLLTSYKSGFTIGQNDFDGKWMISGMKNKDTGVLITRPRDDWTVENQNNPNTRLCLRAPSPTFDESIDGIFIYNVSKLFEGNSTDFKLVFTRTCFSWDKNDGKNWFEVTGESIDDKDMIVPMYDNSTASDACQRCMSIRIPDAPTKDVYGKPIKPKEKTTIEDLKNVGVLSSEINFQTERIGLYWANRLLADESDFVKENLQELEILNKAAIMAYGTCDLNHIPKEFYKYFLLMFRKLVSESFKKYAPVSPINPDYYKKIETLLERCKERTRPIEFSVDESCPPNYKEYTSSNGTKESIPPATKQNYDARPAIHDYLLEFVWRLKSFLHYNCFIEFQEDSVLHDLIQNQLESLFTEDILLRWFNPRSSFKMYDHIFKMHIDLKTTMSNFEKCVRVVHQMSQFPALLKRPIDQPHRQSYFSRRRKRRDVGDSTGNDLNDLITLESEYADMAMENIREKRVTEFTENDEEVEEAEDQQENDNIEKLESLELETGAVEDEEEEDLQEIIRLKRTNEYDEDTNQEVMTSMGDKIEKTTRDSTVGVMKELDEGIKSDEYFYKDSSESGDRTPDKSDGSWNKFTIKGKKGFLGACIQSMSEFVKTTNKDMNDCW